MDVDTFFERGFTQAVTALGDGDVRAWNEWWSRMTLQEEGRTLPALNIHLPKSSFGAYAGRNWTGVNFRKGILRDKGFSGYVLRKADFRNADLERCDFDHADLRGANFEGANLVGANFSRANLTGATLKGARLKRAILFQATLNRADLRSAEDVEFDDNPINGAIFTSRFGLIWTLLSGLIAFLRFVNRRFPMVGPDVLPGPTGTLDDRWSKLRRTYTGPRFALLLILLFMFLLPNILKTSALVAIGHAEANLMEMLTSADRPATSEARQGVSAAVAQGRTELVERIRAEYNRRPRYQVWQILLGMTEKRYAPVALAIVLVVFNFLRLLVTLMVAPMREAEERSHVTPAKIEYMTAYKLHKVVTALWFAAISELAFNVWIWLTTPVVII